LRRPDRFEKPLVQLITQIVAEPNPALSEVFVRGDRVTLAKRLWRGTADDGTEFGFELSAPLRPGEVVFQSGSKRYVIQQTSESVLEISLDIAPSAAAGIGWAIGNLHLELCAEPSRLLTADEPAVRQLLERLKVPFTPTTAVFRPGRFSRGHQLTHELGSSHKH
jgi:urease accessory protein